MLQSLITIYFIFNFRRISCTVVYSVFPSSAKGRKYETADTQPICAVLTGVVNARLADTPLLRTHPLLRTKSSPHPAKAIEV